jgi:hypothetical protein
MHDCRVVVLGGRSGTMEGHVVFVSQLMSLNVKRPRQKLEEMTWA